MGIAAGLALVAGLIILCWPSDRALRSQLKSSDANKRLDAVNQLSAEGSNASAQAIVPMIQDSDSRVASRAVHAVAFSQLPQRAQHVRQAMSDQRAEVREAAAAAAGACGTPADAQTLTGVLSSREDPKVRAAAAQSLGHLLAYDSLPALVEALDDPDEEVRGRAGAAVRALFSNRDMGYRADDPPQQRAEAVRKIRQWYPAIQRERPALGARENNR